MAIDFTTGVAIFLSSGGKMKNFLKKTLLKESLVLGVFFFIYLSISHAAISDTYSYILVNPLSISADGTSVGTITIVIRDGDNSPVAGETITISTKRNQSIPGTDTITWIAGPVTDSGGQCTATIKSSIAGADTIVAICATDSISITSFADPFDQYSEGSFPSPTWTLIQGTWKVQNNILYSNMSVVGAGISAGNSSWKDYTFTGKFQCDSTSTYMRVFLYFRYTDGNNNYHFRFDTGDRARVFKIVAGTQTQVGSNVTFNYSKGVWYDFKIQVQGNSIKCYVGSDLLFNTTDDSLTQGCIALGGGETNYFDDIRVYPAKGTNCNLYFKPADKLKITSPALNLTAGETPTTADSIVVQAQWEDGTKASDYTGQCTFTTSTPAGRFALSTTATTWTNSICVHIVQGETYVYYNPYSVSKYRKKSTSLLAKSEI